MSGVSVLGDVDKGVIGEVGPDGYDHEISHPPLDFTFISSGGRDL